MAFLSKVFRCSPKMMLRLAAPRARLDEAHSATDLPSRQAPRRKPSGKIVTRRPYVRWVYTRSVRSSSREINAKRRRHPRGGDSYLIANLGLYRQRDAASDAQCIHRCGRSCQYACNRRTPKGTLPEETGSLRGSWIENGFLALTPARIAGVAYRLLVSYSRIHPRGRTA